MKITELMRIELDVTAEFLAKAMEEYCAKHGRDCPTNCPFDKTGTCTEEYPFLDVAERILRLK